MFKPAVNVAIDIQDSLASQAVHYIIKTEPRWTLCQDATSPDVHIMGLEIYKRSKKASISILISSTKPAKAKKAIDAFMVGSINGIVAIDELENLSEAIDVVISGLAPVSLRIRDAAKGMPRVSERGFIVMSKLAAGYSYTAIGAHLHVSESTVKREVQDLYAVFKVNSHPALLAAAAATGIIYGHENV